MAIDWQAMPDEEFYTEVNAANAEQRRRTVLSTAPAKVDAINAAVLSAEGIQDGDPWRQPVGAHDAYPRGASVTHNAADWESLMSGNVWEPGVSGWQQKTGDGSPAPWIQPTGAHDAYQMGDKVTHNAEVWVSTANDNVWEPGVYGWVIDTPSDPAL